MANCKRCGVEIPAERLEIMPDTEICKSCSNAVGGEVEMLVSLESTGKAGSLKKNYGSASAVFVKKPIVPLPDKKE